MCFGPTQAPRVFTKIVSVVAAYLRIQNIRIATYLDDWLITSYNRHQVLSDREKTLNLLVQLGFIVNIKKSTLEPTQKITYLGSVFDLKQELVLPTVERVQKLEQALFNLLNLNLTTRDYLHLLGIMASCIELIPNARLYMCPLQIHLRHYWRPASTRLKTVIPLTPHLRGHLNWWFNRANTLKGRLLQQPSATITLTTDASKSGYGGHMDKAKEKYRGVFEIQRSGDKTSSGEIGLDIRTHASPKVGQDQVSGGVSVLCWHAAPVAYVLWKPCTIR